MNIIAFVLIFSLAGFFGLSASINRNKDFLLPMSALLVLLASMTLITGDIQYQTGYNEVKEQTGTNTTEITHTPTYTGIDESTNISPQPSTGISIVLLAVGIYGGVIGVWGRE